MSAAALALVFSAALLHAFWNVVAKKTGGDARFALIAAILLVAFWSPSGRRLAPGHGAWCRSGVGVAALALG